MGKMKVREVIKFLVENNGWYLVRICGSHRQFKLRSKKSRLTINCKMDKGLPEGALYYSLKHCFDSQEVIQKEHYEITIEQSNDCYSAYCPDLPPPGAPRRGRHARGDEGAHARLRTPSPGRTQAGRRSGFGSGEHIGIF